MERKETGRVIEKKINGCSVTLLFLDKPSELSCRQAVHAFQRFLKYSAVQLPQAPFQDVPQPGHVTDCTHACHSKQML